MTKRSREENDDLSDEELRRIVIRETDRIERMENQHRVMSFGSNLAEMPFHRIAVFCAALYALVYITCG
jgi:hypothetical protein